MRDLLTRLNEISGTSAQATRPAAEPSDTCFVRDTRLPLEELPGLTDVALAQLACIDRGFWGDRADAPDPRRFLFLDTETTGLGMGAGTVAFLLGLGWIEDGAFVVRQLLMRDYHEEPLLLQAYADLLPRFEAFVTFNGKCFDLPLLQNRLIMHRMRDAALQRPHLDLLYPARRVWRLRLGDCALSNLERRVLSSPRMEDLPGAEVPDRYFAYLRTGDFAPLEDVLRHNLLDIVALARLLVHLARVFDQPEQQSFSEDVFSLGRSLARDGQRGAARRCFQAASQSALSERARAQWALCHRADHQYEQAAGIYRQMIADGQGGTAPYVELAKIAEHRQRDLPRAMACTEDALRRLRLRARLHGGEDAADQAERQALEARLARLARRLRRALPQEKV
ncbi:MAG: ribonuclease H-like domain-containing protein [Oscillospiraceae bacterium]|jgi:uncharacterized protein YprB with RNaseH-like and TPR domain|nr:ribonuclease H-like domain-containing protein [Oscillospiraceae bacterium]